MRNRGLTKSQANSTYSITGQELFDLTGFIAESTEIIDNLVTGNNHTYEELAAQGLIVKALKRFMKKHKKLIPQTQADANRIQRLEEGKDAKLSGIKTGSDNATLEVVS